MLQQLWLQNIEPPTGRNRIQSDDDAMISIRCDCGECYQASGDHVDRSIKCRCGRTLAISAPSYPPPSGSRAAVPDRHPTHAGATSAKPMTTPKGVVLPSRLTAGIDFPWEYIAGYYFRVEDFVPLANVRVDEVASPTLGAFGLAIVELPNPDVSASQRFLRLPIEHVSDYKSLYRAHIDSGVRDKSNELILLYEHRRGFFGGKRPSLHVAAYPRGTWKRFFEAVSQYTPHEFQWPSARFLYQPSETIAFPCGDVPLTVEI